jgi:hypothetical protein
MQDIGVNVDENPYAAPQAEPEVVGVLSGQREDLRSVARYQKGIMVCILLYLCAIVFQFALPVDTRPILLVAVIIVGIVGAACAVLLAMKVYGTLIGILLGLLIVIPLVGLLVLLLVNGKATRILRQNGIKVGLLGADLSKI